MRKYEKIKEFIDSYSEKSADDFDNVEDYNLILRIGQMYRELEQIKLSYEKLLNTEIGSIVKIVFQARQTLYNSIGGNPRKSDLIFGIENAINDLNKILILEREDKSDSMH